MAPPQWAYQVENFVTEPDEELVCSICRAVFCDPAACPCDHVFCRVCIFKWLQNNRNCPICRKRVSSSSVKLNVPIIRNLIMKLIVNCHNKSLGCKSQFSIESSEAHMKECEYEFVQCRNKPCKDKLFRKDLVEHETHNCPHCYIKCKVCGSKVPTSEVPEKHNCVRALQLRLRRKNTVIRKNNKKIKELRNEIKALKTVSQGSGHSRTSALSRYVRPQTSSTLSSISPDEITINIHEYDSQSSSLTSDSDMSTNSILIFTNEPFDNSDDNAESDSFSAYMDNDQADGGSQNVNVHDANEFRNAESQTMDSNILVSDHDQQNSLRHNGNDENCSVIVEAPTSETEENAASRPGKRRPTVDKPAKRRHPAISLSSDSDDDKSLYSKRAWQRLSRIDENRDIEAGPSSSSAPVAAFNAAVGDSSSNSRFDHHSKVKVDHRRPKRGSSYTVYNMGPEVSSPSRSAVFKRTLALLERYNLESDPEWLPEYASHRGDTTSESDSSFRLFESSDSDSAEDNSNELHDGSKDDSFANSDSMNWIYRSLSTSEDDEWQPRSHNSSEDD